jgi:hypothetical protein
VHTLWVLPPYLLSTERVGFMRCATARSTIRRRITSTQSPYVFVSPCALRTPQTDHSIASCTSCSIVGPSRPRALFILRGSTSRVTLLAAPITPHASHACRSAAVHTARHRALADAFSLACSSLLRARSLPSVLYSSVVCHRPPNSTAFRLLLPNPLLLRSSSQHYYRLQPQTILATPKSDDVTQPR